MIGLTTRKEVKEWIKRQFMEEKKSGQVPNKSEEPFGSDLSW